MYDEILARWDGIQLDLGAHPGIYDREFWCRDRLHPSELGHRAVAQECAELLRTVDSRSKVLTSSLTVTQPMLHELRWAATEATPWLWRRAVDVTTALARPLVTRTARHRRCCRFRAPGHDAIGIARCRTNRCRPRN